MKAAESRLVPCFFAELAEACRVDRLCESGALINTAGRYFWREYRRLVDAVVHARLLEQMLAILDDPPKLMHSSYSEELIKLAALPQAAAAPVFTKVFYDLLRSLFNANSTDPTLAFRYSLLLRQFAECDFTSHRVCRCCYRRICITDILRSARICDLTENGDLEDDLDLSSLSNPSSAVPDDAWACNDASTQLESLRDKLHAGFFDYLESISLQPDALLRIKLQQFGEYVGLPGVCSTESFFEFVRSIHAVPNNIPRIQSSNMRPLYAILEEIAEFIIANAEIPDACLKLSQRHDSIFTQIWQACYASGAERKNLRLFAARIVREAKKISPFLSLWIGLIIAKSFTGTRQLCGLLTSIACLARTSLSVILPKLDLEPNTVAAVNAVLLKYVTKSEKPLSHTDSEDSL